MSIAVVLAPKSLRCHRIPSPDFDLAWCMFVFSLYALIFLIPSFAVVFYYLFLVCARLVGVCDRRQPATEPSNSILIVIPAHDEQIVIEQTLQSCLTANYPKHLLDIVVIADNCQDNTAQIASNMDIRVLERHDPTRPGKGHALAWAFEKLIQESHDAYLVLDADCPLEVNSLRIMEQFLQNGDRVLQSNHLVSNADASPISYTAGVGRTLEYELFFSPKSHLGLAVLLVGTGMVFHRSIIESFGWSSHSCAEDTEFTISLTRQNERIRFIDNAYVRWTNAESRKELAVQRTRWASGNMSLSRSDSFRLMWEGITTGNLRTVDLGWTLLITSRPLVLFHLLLTQFGAALLYLWSPTQFTVSVWIWAISLIPLYAAYLTAGIWKLGLNTRRFQYLLQTPAVVAGMAAISMRALLGFRNYSWNRTPRR